MNESMESMLEALKMKYPNDNDFGKVVREILNNNEFGDFDKIRIKYL